MKILFLTLANVYDVNDHDIYQDLMRFFSNQGHDVYIVTGIERKKGLKTELYNSCGCNILRVQVGNQSDVSLIEKGISTVLIQSHYMNAIKKHLKGIHFDLILYATPPITMMPLVNKLKKKHQCTTYLMLKDIFPQNAVDLGMMRKGSLIHKYFRNQEKKLYAVSDYIGCMSDANVQYLLKHNCVQKNRVEICPNSLLPKEKVQLQEVEEFTLKRKYNIPDDKLILVYGGNLGKPQGIPFLIRCLIALKDDEEVFILIVGGGSEYKKIESAILDNNLKNVLLLERLPRADYFRISSLADVGLIFLDYRFTIPNFPSRILPYMENEIPVACVTDDATDIGDVVQQNNFGWKCSSNNLEAFIHMVNEIKTSHLKTKGKNGRKYLEEVYNTEICYRKIMEKILRKSI